MQTADVNSIFRVWRNKFAPKNLIDSDKTAQLLAEYVAANYEGIVSIETLNAAAAALGTQVVTPEPSQREKDAARAAKEQARQRRDYQDSIKQRSVTEVQKINSQDADAAKAVRDAKELATLKSEIAREIGNYIVGHPSGGTNYSATEEGRSKLQKVAGAYPLLKTVAEAKAVLDAVKTAKYKLA